MNNNRSFHKAKCIQYCQKRSLCQNCSGDDAGHILKFKLNVSVQYPLVEIAKSHVVVPKQQQVKKNPVTNWRDPIKQRILLRGLKCSMNAFVNFALI